MIISSTTVTRVPGHDRVLVDLGALVAALGLVVLAGWHTGNTRVIQVYPGFTFMAYNSAMALVFLGSALLALGLGRDIIARVAAGAAGLLMLPSLAEYAMNISLGASGLMERITMPAGELASKPVAPNTAIAMVSLAIAILSAGGGRSSLWRTTVATVFAAVGLGLGATAFTGYLSGFNTFAWGTFTPMAIHTAIGVILLSVGLLIYSWRSTTGSGRRRTFWLLAVIVAAGGITALAFWWALESVESAHLEAALRSHSRMPETVLIFGLLMTGFLAVAVYLEQKLVESQGKYRMLFEGVDEGFCTFEVFFDENHKATDYRFLEINPSFEKHTGIRNAQGRRIREFAPQLEEYWFGIYGRVALTGEPVRFESEAAQLHRWYDVYAFRVGEPEENQVAALFRDITERKRSQEALQESEAALRTLADAVPQMVWICMPDGLNVYFNQQWVDYTGLSLAESYGKGWNATFHPDDKQSAWEAWNRATGTGEVYRVESRLRAADGNYRWFLMRGVPLRDPAGRIVKWFGTCTDIHELKRAEDALRKLNADLRQASAYNRSLIEASLDPLVTIAPDGRITDVNRATEEVTGYAGRELIGTDFCDYFTDRERARRAYRQVFEEGQTHDLELEVRHRDGTTRPVLYNASVYRNEAGETAGVFAAARDIARRKQFEREVLELNASLERRVAERTADLSALNQELEAFNYSVSHDLRAPLRHIDGYARILLNEHGGTMPEDARQCMERICVGAQRMGLMIDELLELSRISRREPCKQVTGLEPLVRDVIEELNMEVQGRSVEWRVGGLPFADCDPTLMRQVFVNLLSNAVKFTRTRNPAVIEVGQLPSERETVLFVRDNGVGFSMKYADKLFGVFQRLHRREDFEGTGVGLVTVQRVIRKHGGRIWAEAELEKGATFYFTLESPSEGQVEACHTPPDAVLAGR